MSTWAPPKDNFSESVGLEENLNGTFAPKVMGEGSCDRRLPNKPPPDELCVEVPATEPSLPANKPPPDGLCAEAVGLGSGEVPNKPFDVVVDFAD